MLLCTFATLLEAEKAIDRLQAKQDPEHASLYTFSQGAIVITGIGPFSVLSSLEALDGKYNMVLNFGIAGALNKTLPIGSTHKIASCEKFFWHPRAQEKEAFGYHTSPILHTGSTGKKLLSCDFPLHDTSSLSKSQKTCDLVDMEGYATAWFLEKKQIPYVLTKAVSDHCSKTTPQEIRKRLSELSEKLADCLEASLTT